MGGTRSLVSVIGQGTWQMERDDRKACIAALRRGIELGMDHIDTAELYGRGKVEEQIVAPAIRGQRERVFLASKVRPPYTSYRQTLRSCHASLRRLGTDHLDLLLLHWRGEHPLEEALSAFERLRADGKIRAYGVSNLLLPELQQAVRLAGEGRIACNQVAYSLLHREPEDDLIAWCARHSISVVGYSPLAMGRLPLGDSPGGRVLDLIAQARGATPRQVALRFLLRHPNVLVIPKQARLAHVEENAAAAGLELTREDLALLDQTFPLVRAALPRTWAGEAALGVR